MEEGKNNPYSGSIELNWPGKHCMLGFNEGKWRLTPYETYDKKRALLFDSRMGEGDDVLGYCVEADIISSLKSVYPYVASSLQFIYFDAPRLTTFQAEAESGYATSTWLSLIQQSAQLALPCLKRTGFFAIHTDEQMCHYARIILEEVYGKNHYVGTFVWQKQYAPQNDHNVPTDVLDYIVVFSKCDIDDLEKIGVLVTPKDLKDDGDFRGCYIDGHKGARSGSEATKFKINTSPYHWEIVDSNLPQGRYHFDGILGSLWFESVNETGDFHITVKATDKSGHCAQKTIRFKVRDAENIDDVYTLPDRIWWLLKKDNDISKGGELCVEDLEEKELTGISGQEFSLVFKAKGGEPFTMRSDSPGSGRYWEFGLKTLIEGIARAKASFGSNGSALPSIKKFFDRNDAKKRQAVMNFLPWYDYGHTQDATQHCKSLKQCGLVGGKINMTAKPQKLLAHLISLLAPKTSDMVMALGDSNAVFGCVAMKLQRKFIHVTGSSDEEIRTWDETAKKRLSATLDGKDEVSIEGNDAIGSATVPQNGCLDILKISKSRLQCNTKSGDIEPLFDEEENVDAFYAGLAGAYKTEETDFAYYGIDGRCVIVVPEDEELDAMLLDKYRRKYPSHKLVVIYEAMEGMMNLPKNVVLRRAPFELI